MGLLPLLAVTVFAAAAVGGVSAAPSPTAFQPCAAGIPTGVDFNGDRVPDAAVGVPGKTVDGVGEAGMVEIRDVNGHTSTLTAERPATNDNFGRTLQPADLNADVCTDLVVAAPSHDVVGDDNSGAVYVFLGTPTGFHEAGLLRPGAGGVPGVPDAFAYFGHALGFGGGQLYIGAPEAAVGSANYAGTVTVLELSFTEPGEVQTSRGRLLTENSPQVRGTAEQGDAFGASIVYFRSQWIIGAPGNGTGGAVFVIGHDGLASVLTQGSPGLSGVPESKDNFGASLYIYDDNLVVGTSSESIGSVPAAGMIHVIPFEAAILRTEQAVGYSQNSPGVAGAAEIGDGFGGAFGTSLDGRLLVGVPNESVGSVLGAGMVSEIGTGKGWNLNSPGVPSDAVSRGRFGASLGRIGNLPLAGAPYANGTRGLVISGLGQSAAKVWTLSVPGNASQAYGDSLTSPGSSF